MRFKVRRRYNFSTFIFIIISFLIIFTLVFWQIEINLKPTLMAIAETKATVVATQTINNVINSQINIGIDPKTLVNITLDDRGRVVLIQPNTMEFNKLAAVTAIKVQDALKEIPNQKIYIPMGQLSGSKLLASLGPMIVVTVVPMGTVEVKVIDKFEQAGINQTRHMVHLMATTQIRIVVPLVSKNIEVNTQILVAEHIIVGEVPNTYVQLPFSLNN